MDDIIVTIPYDYRTPRPLRNYTAKPATMDGVDGHWSGEWMVYDMYEDLPPKPVFVGSMEDAGGVADVLNRRHRRGY